MHFLGEMHLLYLKELQGNTYQFFLEKMHSSKFKELQGN